MTGYSVSPRDDKPLCTVCLKRAAMNGSTICHHCYYK